MGGRFSRQRKAPANAPEAVRLVLTLAEGGAAVRVSILPSPPSPPARRPTPCPSVPEEHQVVRVQLQESFSPNKAVHLVLLTTDKAAQGSELGHAVGEWMGTPCACAEEVAALAAQQEAAAAARPRSPVARLAGARARSAAAH